jgi:hypothetical protein
MSALTLRERFLAGGILTGLACVALTAQVAAQRNTTPPPDFSSNEAGWVAVGDLIGVPGGPPIVANDPAHPYVPNNTGG